MKHYQDFVQKTLVDMYLDEFIGKAKESENEAFRLLNSHWAFHGMRVTAKRVAKFHELDLNNRDLDDVVEAVIAEIYEETNDYMDEYHMNVDYGDNW